MALEIERKFLIAPLDPAGVPLSTAPATTITQVYLTCPAGEERVRARVHPDTDGTPVTTYTHTTKTSVSPGIDEEVENIIDADTAAQLLGRADPDCRPVVKTRWTVEHGTLTLEIDHISAPIDLWILEVELPDARMLHDDLRLPGTITVIGEATGDKTYKNRSIAGRTT
jgi:CYTH domain-containing protein